MSQSIVNASTCLGFLSVQQESPGSYLGGYLVTNGWGRPLEFRVSSVVRPSRIQQILYSGTLLPYLCADLIGKTLVEKAATRAHFLLTDHPAALELRLHFDTPVGWLPGTQDDMESFARIEPHAVACHPQYKQDAESFRILTAQLNGMDLAEPFMRVREAIAEAKKTGATNRV